MTKALSFGMFCVGISALAYSSQAAAQEAGTKSDEVSQGQHTEADNLIIVTAQKRAQSINSVGISITAADGEELKSRGVAEARDLVKIVPGFTYTESFQATPVYTLRGVGLYDAGLSSVPSVAIYIDEFTIPYPVMSQAVGLDLERVEVLKGPQGTLYGQNSTGGAINYIAAKPTDFLDLGADALVDQFGMIDVSGFASGPISDSARVRIAARSVQGGAWQKNAVNGAELGDQRKLQARFLLDADLTDDVTIRFMLTGWQDKSDTQAGQLADIWIGDPSDSGIPRLPNGANSPFITQPVTGQSGDPRLAGFLLDYPNRNDTQFVQAALRTDIGLSPDLTLSALGSYSYIDYNSWFQTDGSSYKNLSNYVYGTISHYSAELRLAYDTDKFHGLLGGTFDRSGVVDRLQIDFEESSLGGINLVFGLPDRLALVESSADQTHKTFAAFMRGEYEIASDLSVIAGVRYTRAKIDAVSCTRDLDPDQGITKFFRFLSGGYPIPDGACYTLSGIPGVPPGARPIELDEDSLAWNFGVNYKITGEGLIYANISRGYKGGVVPNVGASVWAGFDPAVQERVDAYEIGLKLPLANNRIQFNATAFYYDYLNKQYRGTINDPTFGTLEKLNNVPKSRIFGQEISITARVTDNLRLSAAAVHLDDKVTESFETFDPAGIVGDMNGADLPFTPDWSGNADIEYSWDLSGGSELYAGAGLTFQSKDLPSFITPGNPIPAFELPAYTLIDLRLGVRTDDGKWTVEAFGRNITNEYYRLTTYKSTDSVNTFAGRPATYGVRASFRY